MGQVHTHAVVGRDGATHIDRAVAASTDGLIVMQGYKLHKEDSLSAYISDTENREMSRVLLEILAYNNPEVWGKFAVEVPDDEHADDPDGNPEASPGFTPADEATSSAPFTSDYFSPESDPTAGPSAAPTAGPSASGDDRPSAPTRMSIWLNSFGKKRRIVLKINMFRSSEISPKVLLLLKIKLVRTLIRKS